MSKKLTTEQFITKSKKVHGNKYDYSKVQYVNNNTKVCIICPKHGEFWQSPNKHMSGCGCRKCKNCLTTEEFISKAKKIHGDQYDYSKVNYIDSKTKVCIICPIHGPFYQLPHCHLQGKGCYKCGRQKSGEILRNSLDDFIHRVSIVHNNKYTYEHINYKNLQSKIIVTCPEHGDFEVKASSHLYGSGCPKCSEKYIDTQKFIEMANRIHNFKYNYDKTKYVRSSDKVTITCKVHGDFLQRASSHLQGAGCPKCLLKSQTDLFEKLLKSFPEENILFEVTNKIVPWIGRQRFDIYFLDYNIAIEYDGIQHYVPVERFGGKLGLNICKSRDELKEAQCKLNNCYLFRLKYNYTEEDFENLILNIRNIINENI